MTMIGERIQLEHFFLIVQYQKKIVHRALKRANTTVSIAHDFALAFGFQSRVDDIVHCYVMISNTRYEIKSD